MQDKKQTDDVTLKHDELPKDVSVIKNQSHEAALNKTKLDNEKGPAV